MLEQGNILEVANLQKVFRTKANIFGKGGQAVHAVDGVSFSLKPGETLGLVGESGSGKSTLGRLVLRLIDPTSGSVKLNGEELTDLNQDGVRRIRREIQMVFQDPYGSLDPRQTIYSALTEALRIHGMWESQTSPEHIRDTLLQVGLNPDHANRYPHQFSGGQRQRVGIARALILNPKVLVLDEPVSALDVSIQAQIINLLKRLQRDRGLAYVFIAHDLAVVRHVSDRVAVLYLGKVVEIASREQLYGRPAHPYTKALLSAVPEPDPDESTRKKLISIGEIGSATRLPTGCRFHPRCYRAKALGGSDNAIPEICMTEDPPLVTGESGGSVACHFASTRDDEPRVEPIHLIRKQH